MTACPICNNRGVYEDACGNPDRICSCEVGQAWVGGGPSAATARKLAAINAEIDRLLEGGPAIYVNARREPT